MGDEKVKRSTLIRRKQKALAEDLRAWRTERIIAAEKRSKEAAEARAKSKVSRGVDRVPDHLKPSKVQPQAISADADDNYFMRRAVAKRFGKRDELGHYKKAELRPGWNVPYVNPERKQRTR